MDGKRGQIGSAVIFDDNDIFSIGTSAPYKQAWDTTDDNANFIKGSFDVPGSVDVAIFAIGIDILGVDLTFFNGLTEPAFAVIDADRDSYIKIGFRTDDIAQILSNR